MLRPFYVYWSVYNPFPIGKGFFFDYGGIEYAYLCTYGKSKTKRQHCLVFATPRIRSFIMSALKEKFIFGGEI